MSRLTASALSRAAHCPPSATLPHHELPPNEFRSTGLAVHAVMETGKIPAGLEVDKEEVEAIAAQARKALADAGALSPSDWRWEVALAFNPEEVAGRELGQGIDRNYEAAGATALELCGTADAIAVEGKTVRILELKTGWRPVAADDWQVKFLALAAASAYGCTEAEVLLLTAHADDARIEFKTFDALDLDAILQDLRNLLAEVARQGKAQPGDWCRYCPAMASCGAAVGLISALANLPDTAPVDVGTAAHAYDMVKTAKVVIARIESQLEALATAKPLPLGNGRFWGIRENPQWTFSDSALAELRAVLGAPAEKAIKQSVSTTSLTKALGKVVANDVIGMLAKRGMASQKMVAKMAEFNGDE